jgi:hypothetical protein
MSPSISNEANVYRMWQDEVGGEKTCAGIQVTALNGDPRYFFTCLMNSSGLIGFVK